jgi:branched-chain amino acid transport system permease protein
VMGIVLNFLSLRGVFGSYDDTVFGAILIGMLVFVPPGMLGRLWGRARGLVARKGRAHG